MESPEDPTPAVQFRPSKKRKAYRQRNDHDQDSQPAITNHSPPPSPKGNQDDEEESAAATAMRIRNAHRARLRRVQFTSDASLQNDSHAVVKPATSDENLALKGIPDRFTHQTGLVATLNDKHMNEYIESRLSNRDPAAPEQQHHERAPAPDAHATQTGPKPEHTAKHGKLVEVDVPLDTRLDSRKRKPDTEPARPKRGRNRRGSDDIKRDQLVEAFLHENKLDVYDVPVQNNSLARGDDLSADDRMADEFRQRYLDEIAARRQKKRPVQVTKQQQQQAADVLKGPKLGGSRNQRAAARDALLKQEKEKSGRRF